MSTRPRGGNPQRITVHIRGGRGTWWTRPPGAPGPGSIITQAPPVGDPAKDGARPRGRKPDGIPNPQAFSLPTIQTYPKRTTTCRECPELNLISCARGCCMKLSRGHSFLLNAVTDGTCPLGKFTQEL